MLRGRVIRWRRSTNSSILHLDNSRHHEMSVDSFPFMCSVPFLRRTFIPEQRQTEGVIQSDQTPETPGTEGVEGVT